MSPAPIPNAAGPDWTALNQTVGAGAWTTQSAGQLVLVGLQVTLSGLVAQIRQDFGAQAVSAGIFVFCDSLLIDQPGAVLSSPLLQVMAREIIVPAGTNPQLALQTSFTSAGAQWLVSQLRGPPLSLVLQAAGTASPAPVVLATDPTQQFPQVIQIASGSPPAVSVSGQPAAVAGLFGLAGGYEALSGSFQAATLLLDTDPALAKTMLSWVVGCASAVASATGGPAPAGGSSNFAGLLNQSTALLLGILSQAAGTRYVPLLSANFYADEVQQLLPVAADYEQTLQALQTAAATQATLAGFAGAQSANAQAQALALQAALSRIAADARNLGNQLVDTQGQFEAKQAAASAAKTAFEAGLTSYNNQAVISAVINSLILVGTVAVAACQIATGAGAPGGAATLAADANSAAAAATTQGSSLMTTASGLVTAAKGVFPLTGIALQAGQAVMTAVSQAIVGTGGSTPSLPPAEVGQTASCSILGLNPVTFWQAYQQQAETQLQPAIAANVGGASAFLAAIKLMATYGEAVGNAQMALIRVQGRAADTLGRLQAAQNAVQNWNRLGSSIADQTLLLQAQVAAIQRDYVNLKRALLVAVEAYNEAYFYQWLTPSGIAITLDMDDATLAQNCLNLKNDLPALLTGAGTGSVTPPQDFTGLSVSVNLQDDSIAAWNASDGRATWTLDPAQSPLPSLLGGSAAAYLSSAQFTLPGARPDPSTGLIEVRVSTSGNYRLVSGGTTYDFVSSAISMECAYEPSTNQVKVAWAFAQNVAALYLRPSPFTLWTLKLQMGTCPAPTAVILGLGGVFLQV